MLADCLSSLEAQDYDRLDVLISDNASTDATEEICKEFTARDSRFRYHRQPENIGAARNYNYVMTHSRGDLYKMAAHDDLLGPGFLHSCAEALERHPEAVLAFPRTRYLDERGEPTHDYDAQIQWSHAPTAAGRLHDLFCEEQSSYLHLCYPVMGLMRRDAAMRTRGIQSFKSADAAMLVELALMGDFVEVPEPLYLKRLHDNTSMRANVSEEDFAAWYDPANVGREPMAAARMAWSNLTAVWRCAPMADRPACTAEVARWFFSERRWRIVGAELRDSVSKRMRRAG